MPAAFKYLLQLTYLGTKYHGWQRQAKHPSVQQTLEDALSVLLRKKTVLVGCGRTDTGVHASQYFAHFVAAEAIGFDLPHRLNSLLPPDISIIGVQAVPVGFHAQRDATARSYTYHIHTQKSPFLHGKSTFCEPTNLDHDRLQQAVALLPHSTDFRAFCKQPDLYKSTVCRLTVAQLSVSDKGERLRFDFTSDRFLRNMVRLLVGNVLEVGYGRLPLGAFAQHLQSGERPRFFNLARPEGLYLSGVRYSPA